MTLQESLDLMCRRCENYEVCEGTGCQPKNNLQELIDDWEEEKTFRHEQISALNKMRDELLRRKVR